MKRLPPTLAGSLAIVAALTLGACSNNEASNNSADGTATPPSDAAKCGGYDTPGQDLIIHNNTASTLSYAACHAYQTTAWLPQEISPGQSVNMGFVGASPDQQMFHPDDGMEITFNVDGGSQNQRVMHFHTSSNGQMQAWMDNDQSTASLFFDYNEVPPPTFTIDPPKR